MPELSKPRRILLTTDAVGGVWTYSLDLARELSQLGTETVLAVLGPPPHRSQEDAARAIPGLQLLATGLPLDWTAETPDTLRETSRALGNLAAEHQVDTVQLHAPALAVARQFDCPVVTLHHSCPATWWQAVKGDEPLPAGLAWRRDLAAEGLQACDLVAAPTGAFGRMVADTYGLEAAPLVIHNGRSLARRDGAGVRPDEPGSAFVMSSGRMWDEGKNFAALDQAAALLDVPVMAAGPVHAPHGGSVSFRHIKELGTLQEEALRHWLELAPVFVSTALYEPFGLGVLEAAQAGCALVLSDIPSFRELWSGAAIFVAPRDARAIAGAVSLLLSDALLRERLATRAHRRALSYSAATMARETAHLHAGLMQSGWPVAEAAA